METAKSYTNLLSHLKNRFTDAPNRHLRLLGIVFCRPELKLAREEIMPSLAYFHQQSGKNIDFYFAGSDEEPSHESNEPIIATNISSKPNWFFSIESFDEFRHEIEGQTRCHWIYSGGCDFMLVNCVYNDTGEPLLDFGGAVVVALETLRQQNLLPEVSILFHSHPTGFEKKLEHFA